MKTISDRLLGQYLAEALEPPERRRVERALSEVPGARERLERLRTTQLDEPADPWIVPPPGLPSQLRAATAPAAVMDSTASAWWVVRLDASPEVEDHTVVVLEREEGAWSVVFPATSAERITVSALPHDEEGRVRLDLAAGSPRRVAVAMVPPSLPIDFAASVSSTRWDHVKQAIRSGTIPVVSFDAP